MLAAVALAVSGKAALIKTARKRAVNRAIDELDLICERAAASPVEAAAA